MRKRALCFYHARQRDNVQQNIDALSAAVTEHGSFSLAAAEPGCTQYRTSHAISELERELGKRLLMRSHNGSTPTEAGYRVLDKARHMLSLKADLRASVGQMGAQLTTSDPGLQLTLAQSQAAQI